MKNIFLIFVSLLIISCSQRITRPLNNFSSATEDNKEISANSYQRISTNDANYVQKMEELYPAWDVRLGRFFPKDGNITVEEKRIMLKKLSLIKFMLNTPEFEERVLSTTMYSAVTAKGPNGNIKVGSKLDSERIMKVLKNRKYNVVIRKSSIDPRKSAARGVLGPSIYCSSDNYKLETWWIAFPAAQNWTKGYYPEEPYLSAVVFHEILHNTGFSHTSDKKYGAIYPLQNIYKSLYNDAKWKEKYKEKLEDFIYYYEMKYPQVLLEDSKKS